MVGPPSVAHRGCARQRRWTPRKRTPEELGFERSPGGGLLWLRASQAAAAPRTAVPACAGFQVARLEETRGAAVAPAVAEGVPPTTDNSDTAGATQSGIVEVLCDRRSLLGNPFSLGVKGAIHPDDDDPAARQKVLSAYTEYLRELMRPRPHGDATAADPFDELERRHALPKQVRPARDWLELYWAAGGASAVRLAVAELRSLAEAQRARGRALRLLCHCAPLPCHCALLAQEVARMVAAAPAPAPRTYEKPPPAQRGGSGRQKRLFVELSSDAGSGVRPCRFVSGMLRREHSVAELAMHLALAAKVSPSTLAGRRLTLRTGDFTLMPTELAHHVAKDGQEVYLHIGELLAPAPADAGGMGAESAAAPPAPLPGRRRRDGARRRVASPGDDDPDDEPMAKRSCAPASGAGVPAGGGGGGSGAVLAFPGEALATGEDPLCRFDAGSFELPRIDPFGAGRGRLLEALSMCGAAILEPGRSGWLPDPCYDEFEELWTEALSARADFNQHSAVRRWMLSFNRGEDLSRTIQGGCKKHVPDIRYNFGLSYHNAVNGKAEHWDDLEWMAENFRETLDAVVRLARQELLQLCEANAGAAGGDGGDDGAESAESFSAKLRAGEEAFSTSRSRHSMYPAGGSCTEHTDYGFFTLQQSNSAGFEAWIGGQWRPIEPPDGCAIIFTGDMLERLTNGRFPALKHRVRLAAPESGSGSGKAARPLRRRESKQPVVVRQSHIFFLQPDRRTLVQPLKAYLRGSETDLLPVRYGDWHTVKANLAFRPR